ncbi:hypothetical protein VP01_838g3, partial [Puccinia sorghi]
SHLLIMIGIMLFNIFLSSWFLENTKKNKNIMAKTINPKLYKLEGSELSWDCDTMHIKCFCHKLGLFDHSKTFPKMFSSEANVCSSGHGILKPQTIERCVSSHVWLKQGIQVIGKFEKAQKIVKNYVDFSQKTSKK